MTGRSIKRSVVAPKPAWRSMLGVAAVVMAAGTSFAWESQLYPRTGDTFERAVGTRDSLDFQLGDFSYAGYKAGEEAIPEIQASITLTPSEGDNSARINAAIRRLAQRKPDSRGFKGKLLLSEGTFSIENEIRLFQSGIVISGSGSGKTFVYVNRSDFARRNAFMVCGPDSDDWFKYPEGGRRIPLHVDARDHAVRIILAPDHGFKPGDAIIVRQWPSIEFSKEHGANGVNLWPATNDKTAPRFCRIVKEVRRDTVVLNEPLRYPLLVKYGAHAFRAAFITNVGIEHLSIGFKRGLDSLDNGSTHRSCAIAMNDVMNGWIRDVASYRRDTASVHLQSYGFTLRACKWVSVVDCRLQSPQNKSAGGNGYLFNPVASDDVLFKNCTAIGGRHNFTLHYCCSGVVITGCTSESSRSDFHQYLSCENLFDNYTIKGDSTTAGNRGDKSQGSWWCSTKATFWNVKGAGAVYLNSWNRGYAIGVGPDIRLGTGTENILQDYGLTYIPEKQWIERGDSGQGELDPPSLYERQLRQRLKN